MGRKTRAPKAHPVKTSLSNGRFVAVPLRLSLQLGTKECLAPAELPLAHVIDRILGNSCSLWPWQSGKATVAGRTWNKWTIPQLHQLPQVWALPLSLTTSRCWTVFSGLQQKEDLLGRGYWDLFRFNVQAYSLLLRNTYSQLQPNWDKHTPWCGVLESKYADSWKMLGSKPVLVNVRCLYCLP